MPDANLFGVLLFAVIALAAAGGALALAGRFVPNVLPGARVSRVRSASPVFADVPRRYEFREGYLLSPLDPNDAFLDDGVDRSRALEALQQSLGALSPEFADRLSGLLNRGEAFLIDGTFGSDVMSIAGRQDDDRVILTVGPAAPERGREAVDSATLHALKGEADGLRTILDTGPMVMWKLSAEGRVLWANAPYFALAEHVSGDDGAVAWPVPDLFKMDLSQDRDAGEVTRAQLDVMGQADPLDFEVSMHRQEDGATLCVALPIGPLVSAENALRSFVQTLSQTFAHLPIGLAVFDKRRELVMFNPALASITRLDVPLLSNRPSLVSFLDGLRDRQRIPEPKNYRDWRNEIARLEQGASDGSYQELWTLPGGETLRVLGRPHPDGAVAFMFEDISSEVSLTRKFRGDLDLYHSVLDALPGALAVFGHDGLLVLSNSAYQSLWGPDGDDVAMMETLGDAMLHWQSHAPDTKVWSDIRAFATHATDRAPWAASVTLVDGLTLTCHVSALSGGATLVRFIPASAGDEDRNEDGQIETKSAQVIAPPAAFKSRRERRVAKA